jgi:hypothetical protein
MMEAHYGKPELTEYARNPLERALPPILDFRQHAKTLLHLPLYSEEERQHPIHIRQHYLDRLFDVVYPQPEHIDLATSISRLIRHGYKSRNPLTPEHEHTAYILATKGFVECKLPAHYARCRSGLYLNALSGMGKSTMVLNILDTYPQAITHSNFEGTPFLQVQIPWLYVDCPHDASPKQLLLAVQEAIDKLVGTDYADQYTRSRVGAEMLVVFVARNLHNYHVGLIVVDELQHLTHSSGGGDDRILRLLLNFVNKLGIPILLIGTYESADLFKKTVRISRRVSFRGSMTFERFDRGDTRSKWGRFTETMWHFQYTKKPVVLTDKFRDEWHDASQGITDFAVGIYMMLQDRAMNTKKEEFTIDDMKSIVPEHLPILAPAIDALRRGDKAAYERYRELIPPVDQWRSPPAEGQSEQTPETILEEITKLRDDLIRQRAQIESAGADQQASESGTEQPARSPTRTAPAIDMPDIEKRILKGKRRKG